MEGFSLTIAIISGDQALRRELGRACEERHHVLVELKRVRELRKTPAVDVLVLDVADALEIARSVHAVRPNTAVVLVRDEQTTERTLGGFRLVDRWRAGERLCDELELAYVGIPATVDLRRA